MSSAVPYLPPVLDTINQIVTSRTIPELNKIERSDVTYYLFKHANKQLRLAIAETAYRNHKRPHALDFYNGAVSAILKTFIKTLIRYRTSQTLSAVSFPTGLLVAPSKRISPATTTTG